jgi:hypothetical protein
VKKVRRLLFSARCIYIACSALDKLALTVTSLANASLMQLPPAVVLQSYYRLLTVSGHYNTQLGLLSALFADQASTPDHTWTKKIPSLAAVLVFELHATARTAGSSGGKQQQPQSFAVRAVVQDGPKAAYKTLILPCAVEGDAAEVLAGPGACTLERFGALAGPQTLNTSQDWCDACRNGKVLACQVSRMERQLAEAGLAPADSNVVITAGVGGAAAGAPARVRAAGYVSPGMVALLCVVSAAVTALLAGVGMLLVRRHHAAVEQRKLSSELQTAAAGSAFKLPMQASNYV